MLNVCVQCGLYRADKVIDPAGPVAICPHCGYRHRFVQLPLLVVSGASGTGKSSICHALLGRLNHVVILDSDILWRPEFDTPTDHYRDYFEMWLRMCKNISQAGRPVVLFGAGIGVPDNLERCIERRYFTTIEYLALVCSDGALAERLEQRPHWRRSHEPAFIDEQQRFNRWFKEYAVKSSGFRLVDTSNVDEETTARQVRRWIDEKLDDADVPRSSA